jgi:hypothetical protein
LKRLRKRFELFKTKSEKKRLSRRLLGFLPENIELDSDEEDDELFVPSESDIESEIESITDDVPTDTEIPCETAEEANFIPASSPKIPDSVMPLQRREPLCIVNQTEISQRPAPKKRGRPKAQPSSRHLERVLQPLQPRQSLPAPMGYFQHVYNPMNPQLYQYPPYYLPRIAHNNAQLNPHDSSQFNFRFHPYYK